MTDGWVTVKGTGSGKGKKKLKSKGPSQPMLKMKLQNTMEDALSMPEEDEKPVEVIEDDTTKVNQRMNYIIYTYIYEP